MTIKKAIFCRLSSQLVPRVLRMMNVARSAGYDTLFLSARREPDLPKQDRASGHAIRRIGRFFPLLNGRSPFIYLGGVLAYNAVSFCNLWQERAEVVHCSDFETMPAAIAYRIIFRSRLIYNIHDNLSERYNLHRWLRAVLNVIEGLFVLTSRVIRGNAVRRAQSN